MSVLVESARRLRVLPAWRSRPEPYCQVCFAPQTRALMVRDRLSRDTRAVRLCPRCSYVEIPDPYPPATPARARHGHRELVLTRLGAGLAGGSDLSVLVVRPGVAGVAPDLSALSTVGRIRTAALDTNSRPFSVPELPEDARYNVIVAADVVGLFRDPHADFGELFGRLDDAGVLVCSTQIYDGGDLDRRRYLFGYSLASYFSADSLQRIAAAHQCDVDIRKPRDAGARGRPRRYVLFSRNNARLRGDCGKPLHH